MKSSNQEGEVKNEKDLFKYLKRGFMALYKRPPGRPPRRLIPSLIYWTYIIIGSILLNLWAILGVFGAYIVFRTTGSIEYALLGLFFGFLVGYVLSGGKG
jgi:hypothetical protein